MFGLTGYFFCLLFLFLFGFCLFVFSLFGFWSFWSGFIVVVVVFLGFLFNLERGFFVYLVGIIIVN